MLSAGPIPHNSMHLLIITADFVTLYQFYWICPFYYHFISGVIMSVRLFFLLTAYTVTKPFQVGSGKKTSKFRL